MHVPLILLAAIAAVIAGVWSWLGASIPMPPSPLADGGKLHCVSYAPFRGAQSPLGTVTAVDPRQIEEDLARLAKVTECVRTYSVGHGLDQVPAIAAKHGLKVLLGLWISNIPTNTQTEIETAIALANRHPDVVRAVVVGNEVLLRGDMSATDLVATLRRVKAAVPVPVTHAEIWEFWLRNRDIAAAADFITIHILPYWEDFPISAERAAGYVTAIRARVAETFPGKEILIGETGWPSAGRMREAARPSLANEARMLHEVLNAAKAGNFRVNVIEAFDQPWKRQLEGTVGGYWGLYDDRTREPKFVWGQPVSNHAHWMAQAGVGIAFAAVIFFAAWVSRPPRDALPTRTWLWVTAVAAPAGLLIGLALENALVESFGVGGWVRSAALVLAALLAPPLAAAALARRLPLPSFARLFGGMDVGAGDALARAAGWALIVVCVLALQTALGLAFNPRYKDLPYAPLAGPAVAFLVVAFAGAAGERQYGVAERLAAAVLALSAVYIAFNEGFANWQAQSVVAIFLALALTLLKSAGVRRTG